MPELTNYICINCGSDVPTLWKKYSSTVLKLTDCNNCHNVADKYVEIDVVIIIIDLILLQKQAYRHILFNVSFRNFWKLFVMFLLFESYVEWMQIEQLPRKSTNGTNKNNATLLPLDFEILDLNLDISFYRTCLRVALETFWFLLVLFLVSATFFKIANLPSIKFLDLWKMLTVSSFGRLLLITSLIWDSGFQDLHLGIVVLYTALCQLLAYSALSNCPKLWCVIAIFSSYCAKSLLSASFEGAYESIGRPILKLN